MYLTNKLKLDNFNKIGFILNRRHLVMKYPYSLIKKEYIVGLVLQMLILIWKNILVKK